jgi:hypothetical protein
MKVAMRRPFHDIGKIGIEGDPAQGKLAVKNMKP